MVPDTPGGSREKKFPFLGDPRRVWGKPYPGAESMEVGPEAEATFVGFEDLIRLKRAAGRPQDLLDIEVLLRLQKERHHA